jgi:hypothetical protein
VPVLRSQAEAISEGSMVRRCQFHARPWRQCLAEAEGARHRSADEPIDDSNGILQRRDFDLDRHP